MPLPTRLIVSGNRAPHLAGPQHDVDPTVMHTLCYRDFWPAIERRYGANVDLVLANLPCTRSDIVVLALCCHALCRF